MAPFDATEALNALDEVHQVLAESLMNELKRLYRDDCSPDARKVCRDRYDRLLTQVALTMDHLRGLR